MFIVQGTLIALALVALLWSAHRARTLCTLSVRDGKLLLMHGSLPTSVLEGFADVIARDHTAGGSIRVLRDGERARLEARGLGTEALQRCRNVLGTYTLTRLRNAPRPRKRNLGQRLGMAWLAWRLHAGHGRAREPGRPTHTSRDRRE